MSEIPAEKRKTRLVGLLYDSSWWGVIVFALAVIAAQVWVYGNRLNNPPIRSDGFGYYVYLPAAFIDHDLQLERYREAEIRGMPPIWAWTREVGDGRLVIKYSLGVAVLSAPFFLCAHVFSLLVGIPADGFSTPYQVANLISGWFYAVLGMVSLRALLRRYVSPAACLGTLLVIGLGTHLLHYSAYDGSCSHAYSFGLFSLFLAEIDRLKGRPQGLWQALRLGLLAGLIFIVRVPNALWWALLPLYQVSSPRQAIEASKWWLMHWKNLLLLLTSTLAVTFVQFGYWKHATGSFFFYSYGGEHFNWDDPHPWKVLWSVRKGLFFWTPVLFVGLAALPWSTWGRRVIGTALLLLLPLNLYVVSSWSAWFYGGGFSHRVFVDSLGVFAIGLAAALERSRGTRWSCPVRGSLLLGSCWAFWMMLKYWYHSVPYDEATWSQLAPVFFQLRP